MGTLFTGYASVKTSGNAYFGYPATTGGSPGTPNPFPISAAGLSSDMSIVSGLPGSGGPTTVIAPDTTIPPFYGIGAILDMGAVNTVNYVEVYITSTGTNNVARTLTQYLFSSLDGTAWSYVGPVGPANAVNGAYSVTYPNPVDSLYSFSARYVQCGTRISEGYSQNYTVQLNQIQLYTEAPPSLPMPPTWPGICEGPQLTLSWLMVTNATRYVITRNDGYVAYTGALLTAVDTTVRMGTGYTYTTAAYNGASLIGTSAASAVFIPCRACNYVPVPQPACSGYSPVPVN